MKKNDKHHQTENDLNSPDRESNKEETAAPQETEPQTEVSATPSEREEKLSELSEKYVRLLAEYDNYRKRTAREFEFVVATATEKLVTEFLPVLDNLDRSTEHRNNKTSFDDYIHGIVLIEDQLRAVLKRAGLESIEVLGKKFDPAVHSAIMQVESDTTEPGTVIAEAEKGYLLNEKIIRHPKVVVSKRGENDKNKE